MQPRMTLGDPDEVGAAIRELVDLGIDGITLNLVANAHDPEMIALAGEVVERRPRLIDRAASHFCAS